MISTVLYSSKSDEWSTPDDFFQMLDSEFHFNLDPCATPENHKCEKYYTKEQNGLTKPWGGLMCFAIHHIARLASGFRNPGKNAGMRILSLSC